MAFQGRRKDQKRTRRRPWKAIVQTFEDTLFEATMSKSKNGPEVYLFTDGACSGNPGPGGWGFILRHLASGKELERSGGARETTNNRMELTAVVKGLEELSRHCYVELFTDSVYVGKGITEWMNKWKANGWKRREGKSLKPVKNEDLWRRLDELVALHRLKYTRVAGHSGHPENERCDELAVEACQQYR
jgi:ribonuclease HI